MCVHLTRKTVKGQRHQLTTKKRDYENEGSSMHEDSCIGINYAHMFPKCFRSLQTLLGFALYFVSSIQLLSLYPFIQFLTCTRIPCRDSHCENVSFEVLSLHSILGRPNQLSFRRSFEDFLSLKECTTFVSRSSASKKAVATDSLSNSAPVSWRPRRPDTSHAHCFPRGSEHQWNSDSS